MPKLLYTGITITIEFGVNIYSNYLFTFIRKERKCHLDFCVVCTLLLNYSYCPCKSVWFQLFYWFLIFCKKKCDT